MEKDEKEFKKRINVDKAKIKTNGAILLIVLSLSTYIFAFIDGEFDFGIIFEGFSFIALLVARTYMTKYDEVKADKCILGAIVSVAFILVYDLILFIKYIESAVDVVFLGYDYYICEVGLILYILTLLLIKKDLSKANDPIKYKESTDWFYEKYEDNKKD